jgi:DNA-nicking Smr family endonuclease
MSFRGGHHSRRRVVTPDEARVWRAVVEDAKPLPGRLLPEPPSPSPADAPTPRASPPPPPGSPPVRPSADPAPPSLRAGQPELGHGRTPGLDRRSAERMKKGEMEIDGTLDLHGLTQDDAHAQLHAFVMRAYDSGRRCLLVITGKGARGQGSGVLRGQVPRWLNQSPLRERILGFSYAQPRHGGDGALYVLVRRQRT